MGNKSYSNLLLSVVINSNTPYCTLTNK